MVLGSIPVAVTETSDFAPASSKEFLDNQAIIEFGFTLKHVRDMTRRYSHNLEKLNFVSENTFVTNFDLTVGVRLASFICHIHFDN